MSVPAFFERPMGFLERECGVFLEIFIKTFYAMSKEGTLRGVEGRRQLWNVRETGGPTEAALELRREAAGYWRLRVLRSELEFGCFWSEDEGAADGGGGLRTFCERIAMADWAQYAPPSLCEARPPCASDCARSAAVERGVNARVDAMLRALGVAVGGSGNAADGGLAAALRLLAAVEARVARAAAQRREIRRLRASAYEARVARLEAGNARLRAAARAADSGRLAAAVARASDHVAWLEASLGGLAAKLRAVRSEIRARAYPADAAAALRARIVALEARRHSVATEEARLSAAARTYAELLRADPAYARILDEMRSLTHAIGEKRWQLDQLPR